MRILRRSSAQAFLAAVFMFGAATAHCSDANAPLPPGIVEFAGSLARRHSYLLAPEDREKAAALNRELREAQQGLREAAGEEQQRDARERAVSCSRRLIEQVRSSPALLRVELASGKPVLTTKAPVELPGRTAALLVEVVSGGDAITFASTAADLSQPAGESSVVAVDASASGTTYALAALDRLPTGRTTLALEFNRAGHGRMRMPLDVTTPLPGRLKLSVLSAETGKAVPAMIQLVWRTDGQAKQPGNGIEFGSQFDKQGHASGARNANLPGPLNETFWCVPGPMDMTLDPGNWRIGVRRGVEHEVLFREIAIEPGQMAEHVFKPTRWVDMRKAGWWSGDDHVHCRILSDVDARNLMAWVQAEDVHLANVVKMGDIYRTYFEQRGFGPAARFIEGDYILSPGQECPRTHDQIGHTLAMNITSMIRDTDRYYLYDEVFDAVHAQGGLTGYAHVDSGNFHVHRDMSINVPRQKVDFVEILQFNHLGTELYYDFLNLGCKLTASAGSDVPWGGTIGEVRVYAYLGQKKFSADAWFEAFGRGRTFTTSGPMLDLRVDTAYPGDDLRLNSSRKLRVRARTWADPKRASSIKLEIVRHGEVIRAVESQTQTAAAEVEFTADGGNGCWIAARAYASDGTSAHSTPVYLVRDSLRFWKYEEIDKLIEKRLNSLAEIEGLIAEARRLDSEGKLESDRYRKQLALQGDLLLQRVAAARSTYAGLKTIAAAEKELR